MIEMVWPESAYSLLDKHGLAMARVATPRGWRTKLRKVYGDTRGKCFPVNLNLSWNYVEDWWYCEGLADGKPHAWLSPKIVQGEKGDHPWAMDVTWYWRYPSGRPFDHINYVGVKLDATKVIPFLKERGKRTYTSACLLKYLDEIDLKDFQ